MGRKDVGPILRAHLANRTADELDALAVSHRGIMPAGFDYPRETDPWIARQFTPEQLADDYRGSEFLAIVGRLRDGATSVIASLPTKRRARTTKAVFLLGSSSFGLVCLKVPYDLGPYDLGPYDQTRQISCDAQGGSPGEFSSLSH